MNTRLALAALLLWTGSASADLADAMAKCKTIADASARTICYDAINAATPETPPAPAAPAAPAVPASPPPPAAPAAPEAPKPDEIHGKIAGEIGGWRLGDIIKLQDGTRWKVIADDRTGFKVRTNPDVTIKKSFFSWWLSIDGSSYRTKVQQLDQ